MRYVQYGSGPFSNSKEWINFDSSPTLLIQQKPIIGKLLKNNLNVVFKEGIIYGDIIKGLPNISENSCDGVFCSHVLEHLSLEDCKIALLNTYKILKKGGIFRCIVPDLELYCREYLEMLNTDKAYNANQIFFAKMYMGQEKTDKSLMNFIKSFWGNANHKYMWDRFSLEAQLKDIGFSSVRLCNYNDSEDPTFRFVEELHRFENAIAFEAIK